MSNQIKTGRRTESRPPRHLEGPRCRTNVARDLEEDRKQSKSTETDEGPNSLLWFYFLRFFNELETAKNRVFLAHNPKVVGCNPTLA